MTLFDYVVVYQTAVIAGLGALVILLILTFRFPQIVETIRTTLGSTREATRLEGLLQIAPKLFAVYPLGMSGVVFGSGLMVASLLSPIPDDSFLELPKFSCIREPNAKTLLIFIHGWNGDIEETWQKFPDLACRDSRLQSTDILAYAYPTYLRKRPNWRITRLADYLDEKGRSLGLFSRYEKVAVIAHSMGGIVARKMVLLQNSDPRRDIIKPGLLVEVASPHNGAALANIANALGIHQEQAEELKIGSGYLDDLTVSWEKAAHPARTRCFASPDDMVVSELSANFQCDGFLPGYPSGGHQELVKPNDWCDIRYDFPISVVLEYLGMSRTTLDQCLKKTRTAPKKSQ